ncbi:DUF962 domain-containing protein [Halobacteriovorax sp.]|uniref:Mpo1 family 2-hydroxy fatty acid dioxygenase n=1 Tax=Halobacteriovorax sp. TaxID=2020862 RepID=UPI003564F41E
MRTLDDWLEEYGESHRDEVNQLIHKFCVPAIEFSLLGILWVLPTPSLFWDIPYLNWATILCLIALIFYSTLRSFIYFIGAFIMMIPMLILVNFLVTHFGGIIVYGFISLFLVSWIGQFIGHKIEGKKPSFFKDLLFLFIGPLWVLRSLYVKLGLKTN